MLHEAATHAAIAILRHLPEPSRARFISALSPASALASQMLLGFPDDTVGAWTDPEVLSASPNTSVHEALRSVGRELMRSHLKHCATDAITNGSPQEAEAMYDELVELFYKHTR